MRILGSGTSTGVPVPGCNCTICLSADSRNKRLRTSILLEIENQDILALEENAGTLAPIICPSQESTQPIARILVDTSPDLRYQALRENIGRIDAVLYTHAHADHVFGIDDLRSFNFSSGSEIPVYASDKTADELEFRFSYAFFADPNYEGGAPPRLSLKRFRHFEPIEMFGLQILPLPVLHGRMEVTAFRVGKFAYVTDCSVIPEDSREHLRGLDVLVLDGLRKRPHRTHLTLDQAVEEIERLKPKKSYLTHISHEIDHEESNAYLKTRTNIQIELAWDRLVISLPERP